MRSSTVLFAASAVLSAMPAAVVAAASSGSGRSAVASSPQGASSSDSEADPNPSPGPTGFPFWIIGPIIFGSMVLGFTGYLLFHVCKDACDDLDPPNIAADLSASTAQPQAPPRRRRRRRNPGTDTLSTSESGSAGPGSNGSSTSSIFIPERQSKRRAKAKDRGSPPDGESVTPATTQNPDPNNRHSSDSGYMSTGTSRSSTQDSRGSNDERYYVDDEQRRARRAEQSSSGSRSAASSHGSVGSRHSSQGGRGENSIMRSPTRQMPIEMSVVVAPRPEVNTSRSTGGDGSDTPRVFFTSPTEGLHGGAMPPANTNGVAPPPAPAPEPSPLAQSLPLVSNGGSFASSVDCPQPQSPSQKPLSASGFGRSSTTSYPAQSPAQSSAQPPTAVALAPLSRVEFAQPTQPSAAVSQQTMLWQPTPEMLTQPVQYPHHQGGRMCSPGTAPTVPSLNSYHGSVVGGVPQLHLSQGASTSAVLRYSPNVSVTSGPSVPPGPISTTQTRDTRVESNSRFTPDSAPGASPPPLGGSMTRSPAAVSVAPALAPKRSPPGAAGNNSGSGSGAGSGFGNNSSSGGGAGADASPRGFSLSVTSSNGQVLPRHAASASAAPVGPSSNDIHSPLSPSAPHSPPPPLPPGSGPFGASSLRTQSDSGCLPLPNVIKFPGMSPQSAPQDSQQQHHLASFGGSVPSAHQLPRSSTFESEQRGGSPYQSPNNNIANQESHMKQSSTDGPHQHHHSGDAPPSSSILSASTTAAAPSQLQSPDTRPQRQRMVVIRPEGLLELESSVKDRDAPPRHAGHHRSSGATATTLGASSHSSSRAHDDMGSTASLRGSQRELPIPDFQASTTNTHTHTTHHSNTNNTATTPASGFSSTTGRPPSALSPATFSASGGSYLRGGSSMHQPDADDESTTQTAGASGHRMPFGGSVASDAHVLPPPAVALVSAAANAHNDNEHHERHERNERGERSRRQHASSPDHSAAPQPGGHSRPHSFFAQSPATPALGMSTVNDRAASSVHSASTRTFGMSASGVERHDEHTPTMSTATLATPTNHLHGTEERQSTASGERSSDHGSR